MSTHPVSPENYFHTAFVVSDLEQAAKALTAAAGYRWTNVLTAEQAIRFGDEEHLLKARILYSIDAPYIELVEERPGTIWEMVPGNSPHHIGYFVDDLDEAIRVMEDSGFSMEACLVDNGRWPAMLAYMSHPLGMRIELVQRGAFGDWQEFILANQA
ncbi:VOC family protein [Nocardia sp. NPDC059246]|uniref:VOC family protein n=1 Tax=unclassified Nocardia TaxID=2637762 RepID=UPI003685B480